MPADESSLLPSLLAGVAGDERSRLVDLLNTPREDSGARLAPRRGTARPAGDADAETVDADGHG